MITMDDKFLIIFIELIWKHVATISYGENLQYELSNKLEGII